MKKTILPIAFIAAMLMACSTDENNVSDNIISGRASFSATIEGRGNVRAYDQIWESGDAIGISGMGMYSGYANVKYATIGGDGNFTPAGDEEICYKDETPATFTAYYPWRELDGMTVVAAETWKQAEQKSFDYLWAQAQGSKANPNVAFSFAHKMAKLVLTVQKGEGTTFDDVKAAGLALFGQKMAGEFDTATGVAKATGLCTDDVNMVWMLAGDTMTEHNAPFTVDEANETVSYTMIFFPQTFDKTLRLAAFLPGKATLYVDAIDFTAANANAGDAAAKNEWVAGRQYNLSVTLNKHACNMSGCAIAKWDMADAGNVEADGEW